MDKKLLPIGETAALLNVSIDTLRRWEKANILQSFRPSPTSKRYYRKEDIDNFLSKKNQPRENDITDLAVNWAINKIPTALPPYLYCETSDIFYARLQRMGLEIERILGIKNIFSLITAIVGEIGNNSYNHNIGNWPDVPGIFFGYDLKRKEVILADRGRGIYATLKKVVPKLKNDQEALHVAFTQYISGRAPEDRGNGLKFVKDVVSSNPIHIKFCTGSAKLELGENIHRMQIGKSDMPAFHGCIAIINF